MPLPNGFSHNSQLVVTALASAGIAVTGLILYQHASQRHKSRELKRTIPPPHSSNEAELPLFTPSHLDSSLAVSALAGNFDEEIISEFLARNGVFLGMDGLSKLRKSHVAVIGCGGVGSWCATMLVRSGVRKITIVDFDQVSLSSLNRHACATLEDVGTPKVKCLKGFFGKVAPWVEVVAIKEMWNEKTSAEIMKGGFDFVVDAIDNIDTKVALLTYCHKNNLKVISSMGAGCKSDPTRVCVADISRSIEDPLSKSVRRRLRVNGIAQGIPAVFSTEKPGEGKAELQPLDEKEFKKGDVGELGVLPDFRVRILPVLGTMPAIFGLCCANYVVCSIAGYPIDYFAGGKWREKLYAGVHGTLAGQESRYRGNAQGLSIPLSEEDVAYLIEEVWNSKSVVSGQPTRIYLTRWKANEQWGVERPAEEDVLKADNLVLMTKEEMKKHEEEVLKKNIDPETYYSSDILARVKSGLEKEEFWRRYKQ